MGVPVIFNSWGVLVSKEGSMGVKGTYSFKIWLEFSFKPKQEVLMTTASHEMIY